MPSDGRNASKNTTPVIRDIFGNIIEEPKPFVDLRNNRPAAPNATIGPMLTPAVRRRQRRQAPVTNNYPNPLTEPRGINQPMATPRRGDLITPTGVETAKDLTKKAVAFQYGATPQEVVLGFALGGAFGAGIAALGLGAKGLYKAGKATYKGFKHADSMVPGNRPPRPKQPSQPNTGDIKSRRDLLKKAVIVGTGAGTVGAKNADEVIDVAQSIMAKIGRKGKSLFPTGTLGRSLSDPNYVAHLNKQATMSMTEALDDFAGVTTLRSQHPDMDFFPPTGVSPHGGGHSNIADSVLRINESMQQGAKFKDLEWMAKSYFPTSKGTKPLRDLFDSGKSEKEIRKKIKQMADDIQTQQIDETEFWGGADPFHEVTETFYNDQQRHIVNDTLIAAPARLRKMLGDTQQKQYDALAHNNVIRETVRKNINKNKKQSDDIDVMQIVHRTGDDADLPGPGQNIVMPDDIITEQQMKKIIKDRARAIRGEKLQKAQKELERRTDLGPAGRQELDRKLLDDFNSDMDYIDLVKKQRGRYAQNRTPFV